MVADGDTLISVSDREIRKWNLQDNTNMLVREQPVTCVALQYRQLYIGGKDGSVSRMNVCTKVVIETLID